MDLSKMSVGELRSLQDQVKKKLEEREREERSRAKEEIMRIAQNAGIALKDLIGSQTSIKSMSGKASKLGKVAVRYRHPANESLQWTGRGRQPTWIKEWLGSGKSIESLKI